VSTKQHMRRTHRFGIAAVSVAVLAAGGSLAFTVAGNAEAPPAAAVEPPPIAVEPLSGFTDFTDEVSLKFKRKLDGQGTETLNVSDPGRMLVARITVQPGAQFPWHTHPGPVIVHVVEGDLVYQQASDCVERSYTTAEAFLDPGNKTHTAWNPSEDEVTVLIGAFHGVPEGGAPTIPADDQSSRCT
jgi:quercetin dioxygenase-like cupin family protein